MKSPDKLTIPLFDQDNCPPIIPAATDIDYHVKAPPQPLYFGCCGSTIM
ncbi:hypothetical protein [Paenibacillus durus]